jgi:hypothetical protein
MSIIGLIIAVFFFLAGIAGTILPALPGAIMIWLGMLVYGYIVDFHHLPWTFFLGQGLAVVLIFLIDYLAGIWGVRRYGGSAAAVWGGILGVLLGTVLLGPFGLIFGPFIGAVLGELYLKNPPEKAFQTGMGTLIGFLGGTVLKIAVEAVMISWFFFRIF